MKLQSFILPLLITICSPLTRADDQEKPQPIDTAKSAVHTSGKWKYDYTVAGLGTRSERRTGVLTYDGKPVAPQAKPKDRVKTPWGIMMQVDPGVYERGWLSKLTYDRPIDEKAGKLWNWPE